MRHALGLTLVLSLLVPGETATAQPAPTVSAQTKAEAFFNAGKARASADDFEGALALFVTAYDEFPDPRYLAATGFALATLGRDLEAADAYQRCLAAPGIDSSTVTKVRDQLAALDRKLGKLSLVVLGPPTAEIQLGDGPWSKPQAQPVRVAPGPYVVRGRFPGREPVEVTGSVAAGKTVEVRVDLTPPKPATPPAPPTPPQPPPTAVAGTPTPEPVTTSPEPATSAPTPSPAPPTRVATTGDTSPAPDATVTRTTERPPRRSSLSLFAGAIGAVVDPGVRGLVGVGYQPTDRVRLGLDVIIGAGPGVAPRGTLYLTAGRLRPALHLGVPLRLLEQLDNPMSLPCGRAVVAPDATRSSALAVAVHGGLGLEWSASRRLAVVAEVGYERYLTIDSCLHEPGVITPLLGIVARL